MNTINDINDIPGEVWKAVEGFDGYTVSNMGRVRSYRIKSKEDELRKDGRLLKADSKYAKAYLSVGLMRDGKAYIVRVHALVLNAFVGPKPAANYGARHFNGDTKDNRLANLAWGTPREHWQDAVKNGTAYFGLRNIGVRGNNTKLTPELVEQMKLDAQAGMSRPDLATKYQYTNVSRILRGLDWADVRPDLNVAPRRAFSTDTEAHAKLMQLVDDGLPITDIATELDVNVATISRTFERLTGQSLRAYRAGKSK